MAVIAVGLFVVAIVGIRVITTYMSMKKLNEKQEAEEAQQQLALSQRAEVEELMREIAAMLKTKRREANVADTELLDEFQYQCIVNNTYETASYRVEQATLISGPNKNEFDVLLVCNPKFSAADRQTAGYFKFRWDDGQIEIEWR